MVFLTGDANESSGPNLALLLSNASVLCSGRCAATFHIGRSQQNFRRYASTRGSSLR